MKNFALESIENDNLIHFVARNKLVRVFTKKITDNMQLEQTEKKNYMYIYIYNKNLHEHFICPCS